MVIKQIQVQASATSSAQPEEVYSLLENSATYPLWSMIEYFESLRPGRGGIHGVGAIRLFRTGRLEMREEITDLVPNVCAAYQLLSGFPVLEYHAAITLEKTALGTRILWKTSFFPKYPMTGFFWRALMGWVLKRMVQSLAKAAEDPERRSKMLAVAQGETMAKSAMAHML